MSRYDDYNEEQRRIRDERLMQEGAAAWWPIAVVLIVLSIIGAVLDVGSL